MAVPAAEAPAAKLPRRQSRVNSKGDVSWMMTSTLLVLFMALPDLALFYGGLVPQEHAVLMRVMVVFSLISVLWAVSYSLAFGGEARSSAASTSSSSGASPSTRWPTPSPTR